MDKATLKALAKIMGASLLGTVIGSVLWDKLIFNPGLKKAIYQTFLSEAEARDQAMELTKIRIRELLEKEAAEQEVAE